MVKYGIKDQKSIEKIAMGLCDTILTDLTQGKRPRLQATKSSLDNAIYSPTLGYLTPGPKKTITELNVASVKKMSRAIFVLDILLKNIKTGAVNTKRELYYICKGLLKQNPELKPLDFEDQPESDGIIDFLCEIIECYREELNCYANDRGGQTYSKCLIVTETLPNGKKAKIDLSKLGTSPFTPKNRPQNLALTASKKIEFCLVVESEGTANTLVSNGMTERYDCIVVGAQGVPSNSVRAWVKRIQEQVDVPIYFFGDLDAYTLQNIFRTLKAGSAASIIRNADFSAPEVRFLGVLPEDVKKYDLFSYDVKSNDPSEMRSLKKAQDALENDPFFKSQRNRPLAKILEWLIENKKRCEQQAFFSVDANDPLALEKILIKKIREGSYI